MKIMKKIFNRRFKKEFNISLKKENKELKTDLFSIINQTYMWGELISPVIESMKKYGYESGKFEGILGYQNYEIRKLAVKNDWNFILKKCDEIYGARYYVDTDSREKEIIYMRENGCWRNIEYVISMLNTDLERLLLGHEYDIFGHKYVTSYSPIDKKKDEVIAHIKKTIEYLSTKLNS